MLRKIMLGVLAVGLPIGLLSVAISPSIAAAKSEKAGTGTYGCTKLTGTVTFSPALVLNGTAKSETTTIKITSTGCTGGSPAVTKNTGSEKKVTKEADANNCTTALGSPSSADFTVTYTNGATASTLKGSAAPGTASNGDAEYVVSPATVTKSYPSTSGNVTVVVNQTSTQILAACGRKTGVKSLKIVSGTASSL